MKPNPKGPVGRVADALGVSILDLAGQVDEAYASLRTWNARGRVPDDVGKKFDELIETQKKAQRPPAPRV